MAYRDLLVEKNEHIAIVTLNAPEKLNALSQPMLSSLKQAADDLAQDDDTRVVIITGAGRGFCSGADLTGFFNRAQGTPTRLDQMKYTGYPGADAFPRLNKPVIAAINGPCTGGGLSLALSCDIRITSDTARFGAAQVSRGLVPDMGMTLYLPMVVGFSNAFRLMFTAELISATEAKEMGMVSQVVIPDKLMPTAIELAKVIAQNPPYSLEFTKLMVWRGLLDNLSRQLDLETWAQNICFTTEDFRASVQAFISKLPPPNFKGK